MIYPNKLLRNTNAIVVRLLKKGNVTEKRNYSAFVLENFR